MANTHITDTNAHDVVDKPRRLNIMVNKSITGTITVKDGSATVAIATDPTVGTILRYGQFTGTANVQASATPDLTVWNE